MTIAVQWAIKLLESAFYGVVSYAGCRLVGQSHEWSLAWGASWAICCFSYEIGIMKCR